MQLPTSSETAAARWGLADFGQRAVQSKPADAGGVATAELGPVPPDDLWLLERYVVSSTSAAASSCNLYVDTVDPTQLVDGTTTGNLDVGDSNSPLQLQGGSRLLARWSGCTPGAVGTLRAQWSVLRQAAS